MAARGTGRYGVIKRTLPWFGAGAVLAIICYTDSYYPSDTVPTNQKHGPSYTLVSLVLAAMYVVLVGQSWFQMRRQAGIRRIEMQFLVLYAAFAALFAVSLAYFAAVLHVTELRRVTPFAVICLYALAAWAIAYYRIFDVRQVSLSLGQRVGLLVFLALGILFSSRGLALFMPQPAAIILSVAVFSAAAFWLDRRSRDWLSLGGERAIAEMRRDTIEIARLEPHPEKLAAQFEKFLRDQCQTSYAALLVDQGEAHTAGRLQFAKNRPGYAALAEKGWTTPESLLRRRSTPGLDDLRAFLAEHSLGLMVASPRGSPNPTLIIALGTKTNEWPFTYPEVQRLQNIAELMDNILTRSRLTLQAAVRARMEHLAMMSRGLAHDLNNLITPISSFLVHTDGRYASGSPEGEVHAAARRSVRIMGDYVREALFFSERLTPRFERVELGRIFQEVCAVTATRAAERGVAVVGVPEYDGPVTADSVLLQRMLANVVGNAIDASGRGQTVTLSATLGRSGFLCLRVADAGCGIAPDNLARIFDPYFTTKKYGDDVRGFGLGLTICQKIVQLHGGTVAVESELGKGTTVTLNLPLAQSA